MREDRGVALLIDGRLDEQIVERAFEAATEGPYRERIRNALEAAIDAAEADPDRASEALWTLRHDDATVERLMECMDCSPERATLALGAAFQIAHTELASAEPDLRRRVPELLHWLEGEW
jgi:hypothetical protein